MQKTRKGIILKSWGLNNFGQLGHSNCNNSYFPQEIEFFTGKDIKEVASGDSHSLVLLRDGSIYTWGKNQYNQLGFEDTELFLNTPTLLMDKDKKIENILSSNNYNYAVNYKDQIYYSWGIGDMYVLGNFKDGENEKTPFKIDEKKLFQEGLVKQIQLGSQHVSLIMKKLNKEENDKKDVAENSEVLVNENKLVENLKIIETCENENNGFEYDIEPFLPKKGRKKKAVTHEENEVVKASKKTKIIVS